MNKLLTIIICLVLALIIGLTLTWPKYQGLKVIQQNIEVKEEELQSKQNYFNQVKDVSNEFTKYPEALAKIASALPLNPSLPSLFNFLQSSASQTGLVMEEIKLTTLDKGEIWVSCEVMGEYPVFKDFLKVLEQSARMVEVKEVVFKAAEEADEPIQFKLNIKTQLY